MSAARGKTPFHINEHKRPKEKVEPFDLLPESAKCDTFMVVFDYYTPRAHFIIVPRNSSGSKAPGAKLKIVKAAMAMVSHYTDLQQSAILSVHCGNWGTDKKKSHVHLCVDVEVYLRIYDRRKHEIPGWPSKHYVSKEWKACDDATHSSYVENVRQYPFKTYFKKEVAAVRNYRVRASVVGPSAISSQLPPPLIAVLYHPSEPRVGFAVEDCEEARSAEARLDAQEAIIEFASQYNLTSIHTRSDDDGCHVCLALDDKTHGFNVVASQYFVGYIQVTGLKFYRDLCPHDKRDAWFKQYSSMKDYNVYT